MLGIIAERDGRLDQTRAELAAARPLLAWQAGVPSVVGEADAARWRALDPIGFATFWLEAAASFEAADSCLEAAHRILIRAHLAANDRPAAVRAFQLCRRAFRDEVGVEPAPETLQLLDARSLAGLGAD